MKILSLLILCCFAAMAPAQILVNEVHLGTVDWVEIANAGNNNVDISGYQILVSGDNLFGSATTNTFTFPVGTVLGAQEFAVVSESGASSLPAVPAGVQLFDIPGNIFWLGSSSAAGGVCTITDGSVGLDTVNWLSPSNTDPVPPASFPISISPVNGDLVYRLNMNDPSAVADWATGGTSTPGEINPGQTMTGGGGGPGDPPDPDPQTPTGVDLVLTSTATTFGIAVTTSMPNVPGGEIYNLISGQSFLPLGSGPLFGVGLDAFPQVLQPLTATGPFHTILDAQGEWIRNYNLALPPGLHIEAVTLLVENGGLSRKSPVAALDT